MKDLKRQLMIVSQTITISKYNCFHITRTLDIQSYTRALKWTRDFEFITIRGKKIVINLPKLRLKLMLRDDQNNHVFHSEKYKANFFHIGHAWKV